MLSWHSLLLCLMKRFIGSKTRGSFCQLGKYVKAAISDKNPSIAGKGWVWIFWDLILCTVSLEEYFHHKQEFYYLTCQHSNRIWPSYVKEAEFFSLQNMQRNQDWDIQGIFTKFFIMTQLPASRLNPFLFFLQCTVSLTTKATQERKNGAASELNIPCGRCVILGSGKKEKKVVNRRLVLATFLKSFR